MSECGCVYVDVENTAKVATTTTPTAKKSHWCCECHREILPGEEYERVDGLWEVFETYKTCEDCLGVRNEFFCEAWEYEFVWERMYDHIRDVFGEISSSCLVELTKPARDKICDMIEQWWENEE